MHHHIPQDSKSRRSVALSPATCIQLRALSGCRGSGAIPAAWRRSPLLHCCPSMTCVEVHIYRVVSRYLTCDLHIMHYRPFTTHRQVHRYIRRVALIHERLVSSSRLEHRSPRTRLTGSTAWRWPPGGCGFQVSFSRMSAYAPTLTPSRGSAVSSAANPNQWRMTCVHRVHLLSVCDMTSSMCTCCRVHRLYHLTCMYI